ncbi:MAG TPA: acetate--CoA ligase family protein [Salinivirga sp.]|nr:acetate--CoA ligase family protein [Salinivirga sp.]
MEIYIKSNKQLHKMINKQLLNPRSIVVVGGSDDIHKPGGKVLKNLLDGQFKGNLHVVNPKLDEVQGLKSYRDVNDLPEVDLAIMAIAAKFCPDTIDILTKKKKTRAFIILSAGFSEENEEGAKLEADIVKKVNAVDGALIGPNCIGLLNQNYNGVFTTPIPQLDPQGVDFISGSGATAVFIMEAGVPKGLKFNSVYSVGNSAQLGVEEVLKHLDETYEEGKSSKVKLLYIENIDKPQMLLKHASSLIRKGCKIAAVKSGGSEAGSRAASSHTGALASSDVAVDALFRKAGIVRCHGREELATVASIFMHPELKGKNIAIITHAGGPAVMLTDALSNGGLEIPHIEGPKADALLEKLFPGSSVSNPIDFLATGTAEQLGDIIDACENDFDNIDGMAVIFGSPGLFPVYDVYDLLDKKMKQCKKPIYPILPSVVNVADEIKSFIAKGRINFPDEVLFGNALSKIYHRAKPVPGNPAIPEVDNTKIRQIIDQTDNGYLAPEKVQELLDAAGITRAGESVTSDRDATVTAAEKLGFPVVMKVVGPVHKSDVGGVVLNVKDADTVRKEFDRMMQIKDTTAILMQPMLTGTELFVGAKREDKFGHMVMAGLGGIFIEVLKDVNAAIAPIEHEEAIGMIQRLRGYGIIKGTRGQDPINETEFAKIITHMGALMEAAPEIFEMDLNPLLGSKEKVVAVDARVRIEK